MANSTSFDELEEFEESEADQDSNQMNSSDDFVFADKNSDIPVLSSDQLIESNSLLSALEEELELEEEELEAAELEEELEEDEELEDEELESSGGLNNLQKGLLVGAAIFVPTVLYFSYVLMFPQENTPVAVSEFERATSAHVQQKRTPLIVKQPLMSGSGEENQNKDLVVSSVLVAPAIKSFSSKQISLSSSLPLSKFEIGTLVDKKITLALKKQAKEFDGVINVLKKERDHLLGQRADYSGGEIDENLIERLNTLEIVVNAIQEDAAQSAKSIASTETEKGLIKIKLRFSALDRKMKSQAATLDSVVARLKRARSGLKGNKKVIAKSNYLVGNQRVADSVKVPTIITDVKLLGIVDRTAWIRGKKGKLLQISPGMKIPNTNYTVEAIRSSPATVVMSNGQMLKKSS